MRFIIVERYADNGELSHRALIDTTDGREVGTDGGEPEDASFWRDWAWVPDELNKLDAALRRAKADGVRALADIRDAVLNGRAQLEGMEVDNDIINAVLGIIDDHTPEIDARAAQIEADYE